jgi:nitrite reductase/ring-hydroxylating ferredoxin subunit
LSDLSEVAEADDFETGDIHLVDVDGVSVGVFNLDGEYHALLNNCPHQNGSLCEGEVSREVTGEYTGVGEWVEEEYSDTSVINCPRHGWGFDIETGEHIGDRRISVPTYEVITRDGVVYLRT